MKIYPSLTWVIPSSEISSFLDFEYLGFLLQFRLALSALALNLATYSSKSIKAHHSFSIHSGEKIPHLPTIAIVFYGAN